MKISYPNNNVWHRENTSDPTGFLSGRNLKKVRASLSLMEQEGVRGLIAPLTDDFFAWFTPLYSTAVSAKKNPNQHDIYATTLGKTRKEFPYFSLTVLEKGTPIGGTIFSLRPGRISYAYRIFPFSWNTADIPAGPALMGEYFISKYASDHDIAFVSHGQDRNLYGINGSIGLAIFKLSVGCHPVLPKHYDVLTLDSDTITEDVLVLAMPKDGTRITEGHLFTSSDTQEKYVQVTKYPELLSVVTHIRNV